MKVAVADTAHETLKRNGRSFWFASLFLPKVIASDSAILYGFCRAVDDIADSRSDPQALARLQQIQRDLRTGQSNDPILAGLFGLVLRCGLDLGAAENLVDTLLHDAVGNVQVRDEAELIRYCYGVAGTVGLMMSAVLRVDTPQARLRAIHLGIAMQLTNIARDVLEDAAMGRRYLPGTWAGDIPAAQIVSSACASVEVRSTLASAIDRTLRLAEVFYCSAARGFGAIPPSARRGIRIAAAVYRQIGVELRKRGCDYDGGRVIVSLTTKAQVAATVYIGQSNLERLSSPVDTSQLNASLAGLPGIA